LEQERLRKKEEDRLEKEKRKQLAKEEKLKLKAIKSEKSQNQDGDINFKDK
jgi:hypothetical protein